MQAQQAILTFSDAERSLGDRLLKLAIEIDRVEGYSETHALAIARLAEKLGAAMGLHGTDLTALKFAALVHDIGERQTKRNYLLRPDALTWEETLDLWRHPILGEQAAAELRLPRHAQLLIRWHHESWNGLGYPDGLAGEAIPLGARILRAVDSYFALVSTRPHRQRFESPDAEQIVADLAGIEFDPLVVKFLLTILVEERKSREPEVWTPLLAVAPEEPPPELPAEPPFEPVVLSAGEIEPLSTGFAPDAPAEIPPDFPAHPAHPLPPPIGFMPGFSSPDSVPPVFDEPLEIAPEAPRFTIESREPAVEPLSELLAELPPGPPDAKPSFTLIAVPAAEHEMELVALTQELPGETRVEILTGGPAGKDQH